MSKTKTPAAAKKTAAKKTPAKKTPAKKTAAKAAAPADRSAAIAASWGDKNVAAARAVKNKVKVDGKEYRSVAAAFEELKLPMGKHIPFRMELKASPSGRKEFEGHKFSIIKPE